MANADAAEAGVGSEIKKDLMGCDCTTCLCQELVEPPITAPPPIHPKGCSCPVCKCEDAVQTGTMPTVTDKETHPVDCTCDKCVCHDDKKHEKGCHCIKCKCLECQMKSEVATHSIVCKCDECLCQECSYDGKTVIATAPATGQIGKSVSIKSPGRGIGDSDACACGNCQCTECYFKTERFQPVKECKCSPCLCKSCEFQADTIKAVESFRSAISVEEKRINPDQSCHCIDCKCDCCTKRAPSSDRNVSGDCGISGKPSVKSQQDRYGDKEVIAKASVRDQACLCATCDCDKHPLGLASAQAPVQPDAQASASGQPSLAPTKGSKGAQGPAINEADSKRIVKEEPIQGLQAPIAQISSNYPSPGGGDIKPNEKCKCGKCACKDCWTESGGRQSMVLGEQYCHCPECACKECCLRKQQQQQPVPSGKPSEMRSVLSKASSGGAKDIDPPRFEVPIRKPCDCNTCSCVICSDKHGIPSRMDAKESKVVFAVDRHGSTTATTSPKMFEVPISIGCNCAVCKCIVCNEEIMKMKNVTIGGPQSTSAIQPNQSAASTTNKRPMSAPTASRTRSPSPVHCDCPTCVCSGSVTERGICEKTPLSDKPSMISGKQSKTSEKMGDVTHLNQCACNICNCTEEITKLIYGKLVNNIPSRVVPAISGKPSAKSVQLMASEKPSRVSGRVPPENSRVFGTTSHVSAKPSGKASGPSAIASQQTTAKESSQVIGQVSYASTPLSGKPSGPASEISGKSSTNAQIDSSPLTDDYSTCCPCINKSAAKTTSSVNCLCVCHGTQGQETKLDEPKSQQVFATPTPAVSGDPSMPEATVAASPGGQLESIDISKLDDSTLLNKIESGRRENCECREQIKEIKRALNKIKCACNEAEIKAGRNKPFVKQASAFGQTMSGLKLALNNLQEKCKAKDKMIEAMTGELKLRTSSNTLNKILNTSLPDVLDYDKAKKVISSVDGSREDPISTNVLYSLNEEKEMKFSSFESKMSKAICSEKHRSRPRSSRICRCGKSHRDRDTTRVNLTGFEIVDIRRITQDSIIVKWKSPKSNLVSGYDIFVNGVYKSKVMSGGRTSAMVHSLDLSATIQITIYAVTKCGRCEPPAIAIYEIK